MTQLLLNDRFPLTAIADTSQSFHNFAPYVASVNDHGVVAFQAALRTGGTGIFTGSGGPVTRVADTGSGMFACFASHPDMNNDGAVSVYCDVPSGQAVLLASERHRQKVAETGDVLARIGPLGPTMNHRGTVAFRADTSAGGSGIFAADAAKVVTIADTSRFRGFCGLPVIDQAGRVVFRADLKEGGQGIYAGSGGGSEGIEVIADTTGRFAALGLFPSASDAGTVLFAATLKRGGAGIYTALGGTVSTVIETNRDFETYRGGLVNDAGDIVFYAVPRGGQLGIYAGSDPLRDRVLSLGDALLESSIVDFALNPVSMNNAGQIAIRVKLANERQLIVRVDVRA